MGVTAYSIGDNWRLCNLVIAALGIEGEYSGKNLKQHLFEFLRALQYREQDRLRHVRQCLDERHNRNKLDQRSIIPRWETLKRDFIKHHFLPKKHHFCLSTSDLYRLYVYVSYLIPTGIKRKYAS